MKPVSKKLSSNPLLGVKIVEHLKSHFYLIVFVSIFVLFYFAKFTVAVVVAVVVLVVVVVVIMTNIYLYNNSNNPLISCNKN